MYSKHKSGIPNSGLPNSNQFGGAMRTGQRSNAHEMPPKSGGIRKDQSQKTLGLGQKNLAQNPTHLQQYHLSHLNSNNPSNQRMASSKPILGGGVAGSKYLQQNLLSNQSAYDHPKLSPSKNNHSQAAMNSNQARESNSMNNSGIKNKNGHHGSKTNLISKHLLSSQTGSLSKGASRMTQQRQNQTGMSNQSRLPHVKGAISPIEKPEKDSLLMSAGIDALGLKAPRGHSLV